MEPLRVLLVEDEPLVSMLIDDIVCDTVPAVVTVTTSVQEAKAILQEPFDFALLDIDVTDGKTFGVASDLVRQHVPFVFVSGSLRSAVPAGLQDIPFISKPFVADEIREVVLIVADSRLAGDR